MDRCRAEIVGVERLLMAGHPDVEGLCLALSDWSCALRMLESEEAAEEKNRAANPEAGGAVVDQAG